LFAPTVDIASFKCVPAALVECDEFTLSHGIGPGNVYDAMQDPNCIGRVLPSQFLKRRALDPEGGRLDRGGLVEFESAGSDCHIVAGVKW
jgi:hypothetical protein